MFHIGASDPPRTHRSTFAKCVLTATEADALSNREGARMLQGQPYRAWRLLPCTAALLAACLAPPLAAEFEAPERAVA
jgi:hypothetical protein